MQKRETLPKTPADSVVKTFTSLRNRDSFTAIGKDSSKIILGTSSGNIYTVSDIPESEMFTLEAITEKMYRRIYDITNDGEDFYMLTEDTIYKSSFDTMNIESVARNPGYENIIHYGSSVILWTKNSRKNVQIIDLSQEGASAKLLFTPKSELKTLRLCSDRLVYVAGNKTVGIYNFNTKRNTEVYSGISVQDAVLTSEDMLYIAKSAVSENDSPLVTINISTKEIVPAAFEGNVVFSLSFDEENAEFLYGIVVSNSNGTSNSKVFSYNLNSKKTTELLRLADEDSSAFTVLYTPVIYTNLGKTYEKLGYYELAKPCYEKAVTLNALCFDYYLQMAENYKKLGRILYFSSKKIKPGKFKEEILKNYLNIFNYICNLFKEEKIKTFNKLVQTKIDDTKIILSNLSFKDKEILKENIKNNFK